ncbi:UDP-N-acetyl-D-mannosamine dehydrogenase [uncultured Hydrogenophaga sp.]|uniref:UDP-N-acetyl-D-mannosamine dehydrogenase n=1 Tax=uncultured Hydrogenophaga sp. TaxID=199683 RepID=UPI002587BCCB|nr:UDP-N-acetyl-D-mannosamine dehydrogenase [uncultured Hydrogenophaga sp.]
MNPTSPFQTVSLIGLGYIGLPTAAVLASRGVRVIGVDVNTHAVETINSGGVHIVEPDLDALVGDVVRSGLLRATTRPEPSDAFVIAVPTPFRDQHVPDLSYVEAAARSIAPVLQAGNLVILESTSPVGATEQLAQWLAEARPDLTFPQQVGDAAQVHVAYCPERVLPGKVLTELVENDRVVGGLTPTCARRAAELYRVFVKGECLITNARTAEMCKLTENSFRDVNIAFANELSLICDRLGINVWELVRLANHHPRVNILQPGPGVGGHCIAVDPWFIVHSAPEQARMIRTAREVNDGKPHFVAGRIAEAASAHAEPVIACLGLAFKPDIDDLRESPAVEIVHMLAQQKIGRLLVVEPHVEQLPPELASLPNISLVSAQEALAQAQVVAMLVNHRAFYGITKAQLGDKRVIDTRGVWQ